MDEQSQKVLNAILAKIPEELSENEKAILRARVSYLGKNSRAKFADALAEKPAPNENEQGEQADEKKSDTQHPGDSQESDGEDE